MKILLSFLLFVTFLFAGVDINSADAKELSSLKWIGPKKAEAIVKYREANGKFGSVDEIVKVKGIANGILEKIRDDIEAK